MNTEEIRLTMALTRLSGFNTATALALYRAAGGAAGVYEHRNDPAQLAEGCSPRLVRALKDWDEALRRTDAELEFIAQKNIQALTYNDPRYPARLRECDDAPIVVYYRGTADLNQRQVINIIGTRHCTAYGQDLVRRFVQRLRELCPQVLIVSGLAYGIDICAHRNALQQGFETVGVLAHGLDQLYPPRHRDTAIAILQQGGLLTEFMTQTGADKKNFVSRNRIVAGMSDCCLLVESAAKGGGLITAGISRSYNRDVFAFPGAVGAPYSEGCNRLIRDNGAALITDADDLVGAMGWQTVAQQPQAVERQLFPDLSAEELAIVQLLEQTNDLQLNIISVKANQPIHQATALLFQLEMKGLVKPMAGGTYHLLK